MPAFNYENPRNINGQSAESPEDKLYETVWDILASSGYPALTIENLKKQGCTEEQLAFCSSAEELCTEALKELEERIRICYRDITSEAREYLKQGAYQRDLTFQKIERLLYRHIYLCLHPKNRSAVLLCMQENHLPEQYRKELSAVLEEEFGSVLTELILAGAEVKNETEAALLSSVIIGSVSVFIQSPEYVRLVYKDSSRRDPDYSLIEDALNNVLLRLIWTDTSVNKQF
ncbi:MAG: hypothetical protein ACI4WR_03340 [Bulleidia sp.]